ncbi:MAG: hypothetical protein AB7O38_29180, partial [Pirellulaceae bacterium]
MLFSPAAVLRMWLCGFLSLAIPVLAGYLLVRWYDDLPREKRLIVQRGSETSTETRTLASPIARISAWRPGRNKE